MKSNSPLLPNSNSQTKDIHKINSNGNFVLLYFICFYFTLISFWVDSSVEILWKKLIIQYSATVFLYPVLGSQMKDRNFPLGKNRFFHIHTLELDSNQQPYWFFPFCLLYSYWNNIGLPLYHITSYLVFTSPGGQGPLG